MMFEKPNNKESPSNNAVIGRYILPKTIFNKLKNLNQVMVVRFILQTPLQLLIDEIKIYWP